MSFLHKRFSDRRNRRQDIPVILIAVFMVCFVAVSLYLNTYYHADMEAIQTIIDTPTEFHTQADGTRVTGDENSTVGFIFYPGGKVETYSYLPLLMECSRNGIFCAMPEMPYHLAVFDIHAAEEIREMYTNIDRWYIGGHSLGGSMAAAHLADHTDDYEGLILLGSYSTEDFSEGDMDVLSVYGSEDGVLNMEKYEQYRTNLPEDVTEIVLDGGCHAYFGVYGAQKGDGTPTITNEEQIERTAEAIAAFVYGE